MNIYKYPLGAMLTTIDMPKDAKILDMQLQRRVPTLWAEVDMEQPLVPRAFLICLTGDNVPAGTYIGTYQLDLGSFVAHVYEVQP